MRRLAVPVILLLLAGCAYQRAYIAYRIDRITHPGNPDDIFGGGRLCARVDCTTYSAPRGAGQMSPARLEAQRRVQATHPECKLCSHTKDDQSCSALVSEVQREIEAKTAKNPAEAEDMFRRRSTYLLWLDFRKDL